MLKVWGRKTSVNVGKAMHRHFALALEWPVLGSVEHWYRRLAAGSPYQARIMADFEAVKVPGA